MQENKALSRIDFEVMQARNYHPTVLNQQVLGQPLTIIQSFLFKLSSKPTNTTKYEELDISTVHKALATQMPECCSGLLVDCCKHNMMV
jgi:hypothetical protein